MNTKMANKNYFPGIGKTVIVVLLHPGLFFRGIRCICTILNKFFLFQFRSALFPRIPVSRVDHILDEHIPFNPRFVGIYLDFTAFWIRIAGFFSIGYGKTGRKLAANFITSVTNLYIFAFQIYRKNLSTTARPLYKKGFHFKLIHLVDPHLMCVPSLHVMLMVHSYTVFRNCIQKLGEEETLHMLAEKVFKGAMAIIEAVLYVKQHSVNCIAAALYAMCRFDPELFSSADAEHIVYSLFDTGGSGDIPPEYVRYYCEPFVDPQDIIKIREQILTLYRHFTETNSADWTIPILEYLKTMPLNN
ncbi:MAG: hypothetical protein FWG07_08875 [Treponema sp.]|nr:hypothetical protein [Treponema sp.]